MWSMRPCIIAKISLSGQLNLVSKFIRPSAPARTLMSGLLLRSPLKADLKTGIYQFYLSNLRFHGLHHPATGIILASVKLLALVFALCYSSHHNRFLLSNLQ
jgi:hypothetical protein